MSDPDHSAVYAAELAAFDGTDLEEVQPFEMIRGALERVVNESWWSGGIVDVQQARSNAS